VQPKFHQETTYSLFPEQRRDAPHANEIGDPGEAVQCSPRKPRDSKIEETQALRHSASLTRGAELLPSHATDTQRHTDFQQK
jgi:hypothetical protein